MGFWVISLDGGFIMEHEGQDPSRGMAADDDAPSLASHGVNGGVLTGACINGAVTVYLLVCAFAYTCAS
jgi:hypothetical protein